MRKIDKELKELKAKNEQNCVRRIANGVVSLWTLSDQRHLY